MKKKLSIIVLFILLFCVLPINSQNAKKYSMFAISFYDVENLYDTRDDPNIYDEDYLPGGKNEWNHYRYDRKLNNLSRVLADIAVDKGLKQGAAVIGLAKVENRGVVEDLLKTTRLRNRDYRILHYDSPGKYGLDCALLYNPRFFRLEDSLYIHDITPMPGSNDWLGFSQDPQTKKITARPLFGETTHKNRGYLVGIGTMAGEKVAFIVCHWPSRNVESYIRERSARQVKRLIEALQFQYPGIKIICMGNFNDDPDNNSMSRSMQCKYFPSEVKSDGDIFNPWKYMLRNIGQGTLLYDGKWNLFDQIVMTGNLVDRNMWLGKDKPKMSELNLSRGLTFYYDEVVMRDYMFTRTGHYRGGPLRTMAGGVWQDGFSDHFPTCIYLLKEQ